MKRPPAGTLLSIRLSAFYQQNGRPQAGKKPISQYITRRTSSCDAPDLKTSRGLWSGGGISSSSSILAVSCFELFSDHPKIYIGWTGPTNINDGSKFVIRTLVSEIWSHQRHEHPDFLARNWT